MFIRIIDMSISIYSRVIVSGGIILLAGGGKCLRNKRTIYFRGRGQRCFTILPLALILSQMVWSLQIPGLSELSLHPAGIKKAPFLGDLTCHLPDLLAKHDYINKSNKNMLTNAVWETEN